jgi:hypothetical protein
VVTTSTWAGTGPANSGLGMLPEFICTKEVLRENLLAGIFHMKVRRSVRFTPTGRESTCKLGVAFRESSHVCHVTFPDLQACPFTVASPM